jgi:hypothetical protein
MSLCTFSIMPNPGHLNFQGEWVIDLVRFDALDYPSFLNLHIAEAYMVGFQIADFVRDRFSRV